MQAILDACDRLRDRFLFALLYETGLRIGEALGLRHEDLAAAEREVAVVPRDNGNGARSKSREPRSIPVSAELNPAVCRLPAPASTGISTATTCSSTYGASRAATAGATLPSTTWCGGCADGRASASIRTGAGTPRPPGCCATGVPIEVVSKLLGHADLTTTSSVYGHLTAEDARKALEQAGWFTGQEVRL